MHLYFMVDVEADGPIPADYSMIELGVVVVEPSLSRTFHAKLKPVSDKFDPQALAVTKRTREETLTWRDPKEVMLEFDQWIRQQCTEASKGNIASLPFLHVGYRPRFIADNNGFDWQFVNWYFHHFTGNNPFGFSSTNLGSLYKGMQRSMRVNFKHLRKTRHDHNPVNDAIGNAEAMLHMQKVDNFRF